ncbi:MAG: cytidine deaminase [Halanaerobiales bacterium]|nr:cytidine deaminase [Halanaerobiales bacterium]
MENTMERLVRAALEAREKAYVPYSNFPIGAALLTKDGQIFSGCNIENASYGLTNCAERTAIFKAISAGHHELKMMVVVADTARPIPPCGACRQVIFEFGEDITVVMRNLQGDSVQYQSRELLPAAFNRRDLD